MDVFGVGVCVGIKWYFWGNNVKFCFKVDFVVFIVKWNIFGWVKELIGYVLVY